MTYLFRYISRVASKRTASKVSSRAKRPASGTTTPAEGVPRLSCRFYRTGSGNEPVREWLKGLPAAVRQEIGSDIQVVQWRWPIGKPLVDGFGEGLFEVRTAHEGNIYRVLFCLEGSIMVLLHGFTKKTQKTPTQDINLARKRLKDEEP
jgi:phage-related protein